MIFYAIGIILFLVYAYGWRAISKKGMIPDGWLICWGFVGSVLLMWLIIAMVKVFHG